MNTAKAFCIAIIIVAVAALAVVGAGVFIWRSGLMKTLSQESYESKVRRVLEERLDDPRDLQSIRLGELKSDFRNICPKCKTMFLKDIDFCPNHLPDKVKLIKTHVLRCDVRFRARTPLGGLAWREWVFYFTDDGGTFAFPD